jgi:ornithine--oxo-acid transaminase
MRNRNIHAGKPAGAESSAAYIDAEKTFGARNYDPLPVVVSHGEGAWLWDIHGRRFLDMMSAYSAVSHGHAHPRIVTALVAQAQQLAVTSRAFHNDKLPNFLKRLTEVTGLPRALPSNGGAEAVETALKAVRKWGYKVKRIPDEQAEVIVCAGNFHGRSISIVGFSSEAQYRDGFGPFAPGFKAIPFGDPGALEAAITPNKGGFLVEPVQARQDDQAAGYSPSASRLRQHRAMVCERSRRVWGAPAFPAHATPDGVILAALGGGVLPVSAFVATDEVMQVFAPGDHGSTFGGNPLAAAVGLEAIAVLFDEKLIERSAELGAYLLAQLKTVRSSLIRDVRGKGLFIGLEIDARRTDARAVVDRLLARGIISKDTHGTVVRFAPPLVIDRAQIDWAVGEVRAVFAELDNGLRRAA